MAQQRREIVEKYENGLQESGCKTVILTSQTNMDEYGFTNKTAFVPQKPTGLQAKLVEMKSKYREHVWHKMLKKWEAYAYGPQMKNEIYNGIPDLLRGRVWSRLLGIQEHKELQNGVYEDMLKQGLETSNFLSQIDLDINRTYREHVIFKAQYGLGHKQLFHVLAAYSVYNPEVGYCQGMSELAAVLFMYIYNEEDVFWALTILMSKRKYDMHNFFLPKFPKLLLVQAHHDKILQKFLPKLSKHMAKSGISAGMYTVQWFLRCFLDSLPFPLAMRLWDIWMFEGEKLQIAMSYNILKLHSDQLIKLELAGVMELLQRELPKSFCFTDDHVIESLRKCMAELEEVRLSFPSSPPAD